MQLKVIVAVFALIPALISCGGGSVDPKLIQLQYSFAGGVVKGKIINRSSSSISSIDVNVQLFGSRGNVMSTRPATISRSVSAGGTEGFELQVGGAGARRAVLHIKSVR